MEDIDAAFHHSLNRFQKKSDITDEKARDSPSDGTPKITLSGLLNALDGVSAQEGRLLFATTNRYETLDPALRRPGRMDVHVEFKLTSQYQAAELFRRFYKPEKSPSKVELDGGSSRDSGYFTPPKEKLVDVELLEDEKLLPSGQKELDSVELALLSERFKDHIPDREISMAALQGYLMMHKTRPYDAVECIGAWVQEEKERGKNIAKETAANTTWSEPVMESPEESPEGSTSWDPEELPLGDSASLSTPCL